MSKVKISDVIEPSRFAEYVVEKLTEKSALVQSGIIQMDAVIAALAKAGGRTINLPYWQRITGDSEVLSDGVALTPAKTAATQDIATMLMRGKAFSANDLAGAVAGDDPMEAIASQVTDFWLKDQQAVLCQIASALFDDAPGTLYTTHAHDITIEDGVAATAANKFSDAAFLDAAFKLGDHQDDLVAIAVHSTILRKMLELDLVVEENNPSGEPGMIFTYRGRRVIVDDSTLRVAGDTSGYKYHSLLFGAGAFAYGEGDVPVPIETDRDSLAGDDYLITRRHYLLHPRGVKWVGTPAGSSPSNAELATVGNWSKVYADKNIALACLITNG